MELVAPAGNIEKLYYAYTYGADAVYIGLKRFSLRIKADNFYEDEYKKICILKKQFPGKRLFCALNITFHNSDIEQFLNSMDYFRQYPIDSFIVQDIGIVPILQKEFPDAALHLSTQANCVNSNAVRMYRSMGFKRIVLGRETSLDEIRQIKDAVPDMELEAFCHGAMCIAYSGRCLMSAYLTGRSANSGFCSQSCRWDYDVLLNSQHLLPAAGTLTAAEASALAQSGALVLEEHERKGQYFPVFEGDNFTAVLSSKDLRMIEHLADMKKAGIDAIKIEGRMKSVYYVALVTRAYRKALDALEGILPEKEASPFIAELENVSQRESTTGFYYNRGDADKTTTGATDSPYLLAATIGRELDERQEAELFAAGRDTIRERIKVLDSLHPEARAAMERDRAAHPDKFPPPVIRKAAYHFYRFEALNKFDTSTELEFITPDTVCIKAAPDSWQLADPETGTELAWVCNGHTCVFYTSLNLPEGTLLRIKDPDFHSRKNTNGT